MKALTVQQPYANLIIYGGKDVENRKWTTYYRGPLLIHASKRNAHQHELAAGEPVVRGALIGVVELKAVVRNSRSRWAVPGQFHWVLADPWPLLHPIPMSGHMQLWEVDVDRLEIRLRS